MIVLISRRVLLIEVFKRNTMSAVLRIRDYDDPAFDAFKTFDYAQGFGEVDDPFPTIHALHRAGSVQPGDLRE